MISCEIQRLVFEPIQRLHLNVTLSLISLLISLIFFHIDGCAKFIFDKMNRVEKRFEEG